MYRKWAVTDADEFINSFLVCHRFWCNRPRLDHGRWSEKMFPLRGHKKPHKNRPYSTPAATLLAKTRPVSNRFQIVNTMRATPYKFSPYLVSCWVVAQLGGLELGSPWEIPLRLMLVSLIYSLKVSMYWKIRTLAWYC